MSQENGYLDVEGVIDDGREIVQTFVELLCPYIRYSTRRSIKKEAIKQCS